MAFMQVEPMIRFSIADDLAKLEQLMDGVGLFPAAMLQQMMAPYFAGVDEADEFWLTYDDQGPQGVAYCVPERLTDRAWNMLLIAVHPVQQGKGCGTALLQSVEKTLVGRGARMLIIETSGLDGFEAQRAFYRKCGYDEEARIRDFYRSGDDKVVFRKLL
jgi:GNAT superfamily N-acetyltransferase